MTDLTIADCKLKGVVEELEHALTDLERIEDYRGVSQLIDLLTDGLSDARGIRRRVLREADHG